MSGLKLTPSDYRIMLKFSHNKHLLVEGKNDKRLFQYLIDEVFNRSTQNILKDSIDIDTAEDLVETEIASNREKVEMICEDIDKASYKDKLVGFVDREFREFEKTNYLKDNLNNHNTLGRVIWSRGHSSENYYFDFDILREPLREHSDIDYFSQALDLFKTVLSSTIRTACAISLAAEELRKIKKVKKSITWEIVEIASSQIHVKLNLLKQALVNIHSFTEEDAELFVERFKSWSKSVEKADFSCIRWMSHGHIGFSLIWAVYGRCVFETCQSNGIENAKSEVAKVFKFNENQRFLACANTWVRKALDNQCDYPLEVLILLGLSSTS